MCVTASGGSSLRNHALLARIQRSTFSISQASGPSHVGGAANSTLMISEGGRPPVLAAARSVSARVIAACARSGSLP